MSETIASLARDEDRGGQKIAAAWTAWAFAGATLLGAFLLFQIQPLISKFILPWFGGAPAVWTTCMLFFQIVLFGGYTYSHLFGEPPVVPRPGRGPGPAPAGGGRSGRLAACRAQHSVEAGRQLSSHTSHPAALDGDGRAALLRTLDH